MKDAKESCTHDREITEEDDTVKTRARYSFN